MWSWASCTQTPGSPCMCSPSLIISAWCKAQELANQANRKVSTSTIFTASEKGHVTWKRLSNALGRSILFERRKGIGHRGSEVLKETVLVSADVFNNIGLLHFVLFLSTGYIQLTWLPPWMKLSSLENHYFYLSSMNNVSTDRPITENLTDNYWVVK